MPRSRAVVLALTILVGCGSVGCGSRQAAGTSTVEAAVVVHIPCVREPCAAGAGEAAPATPALTGRAPITMLALGHEHSCALTNDGAVYCWGDNAHGQLGETGGSQSPIPSAVPSLPPMAAVWAGYDSVCGRTQDNAQLFCWGDTGLPRSGGGFASALPFRDVRYVALGYQKGCFLTGDAQLFCWGDYGRPHGPIWDGPQRVRVEGVVGVSLSFLRGCATTSRGRLSCWGQRPSHIGIESVRGSDLWTYAELRSVQAVAFAEGPQVLPLVLSEQNTLYQVEVGESYGHGAEHHLGRHSFPLADVVQIAAGADHSCARTSGGVVACWGLNSRGQVGDGTETQRRDEPRPLPMTGLQEVATGSSHTCARTEQQLFCWGSNEHGQLGVDIRHAANVPQEVPW